MVLDIKKGMYIASHFDVSTPKDCAVLYSISYQKTTKNRDDAYNYVKTHQGFKTLDDTPCGKTLCDLGYQSTNDIASEDLKEIWKIASERFIAGACGNLTAFVENADKRSTFCKVEMPAVLKNKNIKTINGIDKFLFAEKQKIKLAI